MKVDPCEVGTYGQDPDCVRQGLYRTFVRSRHDGTVTKVDHVCHDHRNRILDIKRNLYLEFGLAVPDMWTERIGS